MCEFPSNDADLTRHGDCPETGVRSTGRISSTLDVRKALFVFLCALLVVACASDPPMGSDRQNQGVAPESYGSNLDAGTTSTPHVPCEVHKVVRDKCQTCHDSTPSAGAAIPLVTYDDFHADYDGKKVFELVRKRIQDVDSPMPPAPNKLTPQEQAKLDTWLGAGAPAAPEGCEGGDAPTAVKPLDCKVDFTLQSPEKFTMPELPSGGSDVYMCYGTTVKLDKKRHVIGFAPHISNPKIVHHVVLLKSATPVPATPFPCSGIGSGLAWSVVTGWAPGGNNLELPDAAGFPEEKGETYWVVQIHYNSGGGKFAGEVDQSGYDLCTTDQLRKYDAATAAFGTLSITIPPRAKAAVTCNYAGAEWIGKKIFNAFPHMHGRGTAMSSKLLHVFGGSPTVVTDYNAFDATHQGNMPADATPAFGDIMQTRCAWNNPSDSLVTYGEDPGSEMCFNFVSYYPAIPLYSWVTPSLSPVCVPEIGL